MKITVNLAGEPLIAAKKRAAETGSRLRELIERGLRRELVQGTDERRTRPRGIRWVTVPGGLAPGFDIADRGKMHEWFREHE